MMRTMLVVFGLVLGLIVLAIVSNPELRAFLLLAESVGVEVVVLMFVTQARILKPWIAAALAMAWPRVAPLALQISRLVLALLLSVLPLETLRVAAVQCVVAWVVGIRCLVSRDALLLAG